MKNNIDLEFFSDNLLLKGVLHLPQINRTNNPPLVVGSHGLEGSKNSAKQMVLARRLVEKDIAFFRFDHRGCGQSQGEFLKQTSLEKRTKDLVEAVKFLLSLGKTSSRVGLFGSSMGGASCINAWSQISKLDITLCGAVLCSAPVKSLTIKNIPTQPTQTRAALPLSFFAENLVFDLTKKTAKLSNLLVFHGDADEVVPVSNAHTIFKQAKEPKKLIIHENGDHQMTSKSDQADFDQTAPNWFSKIFKL